MREALSIMTVSSPLPASIVIFLLETAIMESSPALALIEMFSPVFEIVSAPVPESIVTHLLHLLSIKSLPDLALIETFEAKLVIRLFPSPESIVTFEPELLTTSPFVMESSPSPPRSVELLLLLFM